MLIYRITASQPDTPFGNLKLSYRDDRSSSQHWWSLTETYCVEDYETLLMEIDGGHCSKLVMYTFNDKSFPKTLSFISGEG